MFQWDKHRWFISRTEANKLVKLGYNASTIKLHYFRLSCTVRSGLLSAMRRAIKFHGGADAPSSPLKLSSLWSTAINFLFLTLSLNRSFCTVYSFCYSVYFPLYQKRYHPSFLVFLHVHGVFLLYYERISGIFLQGKSSATIRPAAWITHILTIISAFYAP